MAYPSIRAQMSIDGYKAEKFDTYEEFGFIYIESDTRFNAPEKKRETTSYAEEPGEHTDLRTVDDAFDYKIKFLIECENKDMDNANTRILKFNQAIRTKDTATGIKTCRRLTLYNDYKRIQITGIPEIIAEAKEFYRQRNGNALDCALVELTIHVDNPSECVFS